jgi:hypothetical protein
MAYRDGQPLLRVRPAPVTSATAVKVVSSLASSAWKLLAAAADSGPDEPLAAPAQPRQEAQRSDTAKEPAAAAVPSKPLWGGASKGWGFGGLVSTLTSSATSVASNILSAGANVDAEGDASQDKDKDTKQEDAGDGANKDATASESAPNSKADEDLTESITQGIDQRFSQEVQIDEGGISSVRYVSQGITMLESSLGWLSSAASASINQQRVDALVDQVCVCLCVRLTAYPPIVLFVTFQRGIYGMRRTPERLR